MADNRDIWLRITKVVDEIRNNQGSRHRRKYEESRKGLLTPDE